AGPEWLSPLREGALSSLRTLGLPTKKTEAWRFTRVEHLLGDLPAPEATDTAAGWASISSHFRVLFRGSQLVVGPNAPEGLGVHRLTDLPDALRNTLGSIATNEHFVALNSATFEDALVLHVHGAVTTPVEIEVEGGPSLLAPRVLVVLDREASLSLIERSSGDSRLTAAVTEVSIGAGAQLDHVRIHEDRGAVLSALAIVQDRDSRYRGHTFTFGGAPQRLDHSLRFAGPGAEAHLDGLYLVREKEHVDHHVRVDHEAGRCTSHQRYRGVLDDQGTAVFDGQAIVHRSAPGSEAHQQNRNLLLSDRANAYTKPHLEIDHDEVVASHGATVGALDEQALFYLRSRGVPSATAEGILTFAFLRELVDAVPIAALREELTESVLLRLPEPDTLRGFELEET
ncbi:MAG: Fe-S cluster assembly protein SufD, partial [Myxococcota bacterium]